MDKPLILFDVGGVLLELTYGTFQEKAAQIAGTSPQDFGNRFKKSDLEKKAIMGEITDAEFFEGLNKILGANLSEPQLGEIVNHCWGRQIDEIVKLKQELHKAGYTVGLLSNMSSYGLDTLSKKHPQIFETFGGPRIYSFQLKTMKPEPEIYTPLNSRNVVFIDDKRSYLEEGAKIGWSGIHLTQFIDPEETIRAFPGHDDTVNMFSERIKTTNSVEEVPKILRAFGISI